MFINVHPIKKNVQSNFPVKVSIIVADKKEQNNLLFNDGCEQINVALESYITIQFCLKFFGLFCNSTKHIFLV